MEGLEPWVLFLVHLSIWYRVAKKLKNKPTNTSLKGLYHKLEMVLVVWME
jgi:hypothetical protein